MKHAAGSLLLCALLMACGSSGTNPFTPEVDTGTGGDTGNGNLDTTGGNTAEEIEEVRSAVVGDIGSLTFDPATQTLTVTGLTLDDTPLAATYRRRAALDRDGYLAFTAQDDPLDRHITAFVRQSDDGFARGAVASSGAVRNRIFGGAVFERSGTYSAPDVTATTGLVSYTGSYVAVTNLSTTTGTDLLAVNPGIDPDIAPGQALTVSGDVLLQADFADSRIEGNIYDRVLTQTGTTLPSVVLIATGISDSGTFEGTTIEYEAGDFPGQAVIGLDIGDYAGILAGENATSVAGGVSLTEFDGPGNVILGLENETEYGVFVLDLCTAASADPTCNGLN